MEEIDEVPQEQFFRMRFHDIERRAAASRASSPGTMERAQATR